MSGFIVEGKRKLHGTVTVTGNKNEALPLIAAALLCPEAVTFFNVPDIGDVRTMLVIAELLGAKVSSVNKGKVTISAEKLSTAELPVKESNAIRASILFASALLVRKGKAVILQPGGDAIGRRRLDTHFTVFKELGARLEIRHSVLSDGVTRETSFTLTAPKGGLRGASIHLDEASVTATENALIAAAGARGMTVIANAASEPHVQGLCRFLERCGVAIDGIGSNLLTVHGTQEFSSASHTVGGDYIEAGSLVGLAAATGSELVIRGVDPAHFRMILHQFGRIGVSVEIDRTKGALSVRKKQRLVVRNDLEGAVPRIEDSPWPGFPTDLLSILLVAATQSCGSCLIHEKMFESRLFFVDKLISMGASIVLCDPHRAVVTGPSPLYGATISSPDIRAGMALLIAALAAEGRSVIYNIEQIDRGYQEIDRRLSRLGASIKRIADRRRDSRA
ncbi:MAG: UDP-N-acetylglucosamine 1-carboxyvinyltransferase [Chitinispirillaceae bacterium]|nr:UDP-N-acetylglucosamine 1-carboxyvinyltransferase [Chitinispirillaceae bacterium]